MLILQELFNGDVMVWPLWRTRNSLWSLLFVLLLLLYPENLASSRDVVND